MVLILLSAGWQIFVQAPLAASEASARAYDRDRKLDAIFSISLAGYVEEFPALSRGLVFRTDARGLHERWRYAEDSRNEQIESQAKLAGWFAAAMFLLGSCLVVWAKYVELGEARPNEADSSMKTGTSASEL